MKPIIFYSWQSDLPNATNRSLIEEALENAAKRIHNDETVEIEPVIDRDTAGVPGTPDITYTILEKINRAHIFVCDVSIVNSKDPSRKTPNPNVLIELGYASKALGFERIILVMNTAFGGPEQLPFDLRQRRVATYHFQQGEDNKPEQRKRLEKILEDSIRSILTSISEGNKQEKPLPMPAELAIDSMLSAKMNEGAVVRRYFEWLTSEISSLAPEYDRGKENDEALIEAIELTVPLVSEFSSVIQTTAEINSVTSATEIYKGFSKFLEYYRKPRGFTGSYYDYEFDFYRFMAYELFLIFVSSLLRENRWELLADLLSEELFVNNSRSGASGVVPYYDISEPAQLLFYRKQRLNLQRVSIEADLIHDRHYDGPLSVSTPFERLVEADFLLFLRNEKWKPITCIYINEFMPRFLIEATSEKFAKKILPALALETVEQLRETTDERRQRLREIFRSAIFFSPLEYLNTENFGNKK